MREKIEKLKEKIKAKPKLYKTLKVVKFLCNIGAYLIALFTILSLSIGSSCSRLNNSSLDNNKHKVNYALDSGIDNYFHVGLNDFGSTEMFNLMNVWLTETSGNSFYSGDIFTFTYDISSSTSPAYIVTNVSSGLTPTNPITSIDSIVTSIHFIEFVTIAPAVGYVELQGDFTYRIRIYFRIYTETNTSAGANYHYLVCGAPIISTDQFASSSYVPEYYHLNFHRGNVLYSAFLNEFGKSYTDFTDGYNVGYNTGYNNGYTEGYNNGYSAGELGSSSNPFSLISNAFVALAGFLDIQVLPGLNIGVLIFVPLVVTIIIVVVKMFKG